MSELTDRINAIAEFYSIRRPAEFAKRTGFSHQTASNYLSGDRKPNAEALIKIKQAFDKVDMNWLLTGENEMNITTNIAKNVLNETKASYMPKVVTVDSQGEDNIVMVPVTAQAGYLDGYGDQEYLKALPSYRLPKINNGTYRMFEVKGHSMYPTIHDGSIAVGEWVEDYNDISDDNIYIVVTKEDGITIKRVINRIDKYGTLYLKSDNRKEYPSFTVKEGDIVEMWKLKTAFLFNFQNPADVFDRINDLEAELGELQNRLK